MTQKQKMNALGLTAEEVAEIQRRNRSFHALIPSKLARKLEAAEARYYRELAAWQNAKREHVANLTGATYARMCAAEAAHDLANAAIEELQAACTAAVAIAIANGARHWRN